MWHHNRRVEINFMRLIFTIMALFLLASGCSTTGSISDMQAKSMQIHPGTSKDEVIALFGVPGDRSFNGKGEAWQYCSTGFSQDKYMTVWFYEDIVEGLTTKFNYCYWYCCFYSYFK